jgi:dTDP-L-rhamnose 4-epimerase
MYAIDRYVSVNDLGTAALFQQLIHRPVRRVVVASSMSIYGEGLYRDAEGGCTRTCCASHAVTRRLLGPDGRAGPPPRPVPTPGEQAPQPRLGLRHHEIHAGAADADPRPAYGMEGVALRLWNAYGPGQALSNPYTGVLAIFASRLQNGQRPMIFEDGRSAATSSTSRTSPRLRAALGTRARGQGLQRRQRRRTARSRRSPCCWPEVDGLPDLAPEITGKAPQRATSATTCADTTASRRAASTVRRRLPPGPGGRLEWFAAQQGRGPRAEARNELEVRGLVRMSAPPPTAGAGDRRRRLHRLEPRDRLATEGTTSWSTTPRPPGVEANLAWLRAASPARVAPCRRHPRRAAVEDARADAGGVPPRRQVAVTTSMSAPGRGFDSTCAAPSAARRAAAARRRKVPVSSPAPSVYGDLADVALERVDGRYVPSDAAIRATGIGEARPLDFPHALWLLEGRATSTCWTSTAPSTCRRVMR